MGPSRWLAALTVAVTAGACGLANEKYDPAGDAATADLSASATTLATTTAATTSGASASASTTSATSTSTSTTTSDAGTSAASASATATTGDTTTDTTTADTTTADTTTTGVEPGPYPLAPTIAACVFLDNGSGYGPPPVCGANADKQNGTALTGLFQIDTAVTLLDGAGRRAEAFLRFDIPDNFAGRTVVAATLTLQLADGGGVLAAGPAGDLITVEVFDAASLALAPPAVGVLIEANPGYFQANAMIERSIPVDLVIAGAPLTLGLTPVTSDGPFYRGKDTPGGPVLTVVLE